MKLRLQAFSICFISSLAVIAQVPNGTMESWSVYTSPVPPNLTCDYPDGWDTPDKIGADIGLTEHVTEKETANVHGGSAAAKLITKNLEVIPGVFLDIPGTITTGVIGFDFVTFTPSVTGGCAVLGPYESIDGFIQYAPVGADTMNVNVLMFSGTDTVGLGQFRSGATAGWVAFSCPIFYNSPDMPDMMQLTITSSGSFESPEEGSILYVDDLTAVGGVGIEDWSSLGIRPNVYPNPATDHINIINPVSNDVVMEVYNLQGQKVDEITLAPDLNSISLTNYSSGMYTFRLLENGVQVYGNKFVVR